MAVEYSLAFTSKHEFLRNYENFFWAEFRAAEHEWERTERIRYRSGSGKEANRQDTSAHRDHKIDWERVQVKSRDGEWIHKESKDQQEVKLIIWSFVFLVEYNKHYCGV